MFLRTNLASVGGYPAGEYRRGVMPWRWVLTSIFNSVSYIVQFDIFVTDPL